MDSHFSFSSPAKGPPLCSPKRARSMRSQEEPADRIREVFVRTIVVIDVDEAAVLVWSDTRKPISVRSNSHASGTGVLLRDICRATRGHNVDPPVSTRCVRATSAAVATITRKHEELILGEVVHLAAVQGAWVLVLRRIVDRGQFQDELVHEARVQPVRDVICYVAGLVGASTMIATIFNQSLLKLSSEQSLVCGDSQAFKPVIVAATGIRVVGFLFIRSCRWVAGKKALLRDVRADPFKLIPGEVWA